MTAKALLLFGLASALIILALSCGSEKTSEPDTAAPAAIADLRVESTGCDNVSLAWTATGDDGTEGKASSYDLRYSDETITESNWASATECAGEPTPKAAGQTENLTISGLTSGTTYHFALIARDDEGNDSDLSNNASSTVGSTAIGWVNDGLAEDEDWSKSATDLSANWADAACVTDYEYALGTTQGGADVINWTSRGTQTDVTRTGLTLADGETYYFSAQGVLGIVPGTPTSSDGITVDITAPISAVNTLPEVVSTPAFTVTWSGSDATSGIKQYDLQVSSDGGGSWGSWLTATTLTSADFTGLNGHTYHFRSRAYDNAGNVEAYPTVPDAHTTVTLSTAIAWVNDGAAADEDWVASATTLSANWAEAGFADEYEYAIGTTQGGTDVVGWTSRGRQTSVTRTGLALTEAETYYFSVRSVYGGTPATPTSSDGITVDITAPTSQVDALPEEQPALDFVVTWDGSDAGSGVKYYDIQLSADGGISWFTWINETTLKAVGYTGTNGTTYHFRSRAHDNAGNVEPYPGSPDANTTVNLAAALQVDWVRDGLTGGVDDDWTMGPSTLYAHWAAVDAAGGYEVAIGTSPGANNIMDWYPVGLTTSVAAGTLPLVHGGTYYVSVRVTVGITHGPAVSSDGITVDRDPPSACAVDSLAPVTSTVAFTVSWSGSDALSGVSRYDIQFTDGDGTWEDWLLATDLTASEFIGEVDHTYYFRARAYDRAGNAGEYPTQSDTRTTVTCSFTYSLQWGQEGSGDGDFQYPFNVAVDALNNVYVADSQNDRIQVFDSEGNFLDKWGQQGYGDGEFYGPAGVAIDDSGYVYVTDFNNYRVQKFTDDGTYVTQWTGADGADGPMIYPRGISVDDSFYVYVAEQEHDLVRKFTSNGVSVASWGGYGADDGKFNGLMSVAVGPSGNVYALDSYNGRIQEFTSEGDFVRKWGSRGTGDGQFYSINFLAVDASGYVYVTDQGGCRIQRFTSDGRFLNKWGSCGTGDEEFDEPFGIAVGPDGAVYVTDMDNHRVLKFTRTCP